jgi:predicted ATPase
LAWLERVSVERAGVDLGKWPWSLPAVAAMDELEFDGGVTFLAGENGSGKSTVLEAVAVACGCPEEGGPSNQWLKGPRRGESLAARTRPALTGVPVGGAWFLRAETFFELANAATNAAGEDAPYEAAQLLADFGWRSPHLLSHGQSFLGLFDSRMGGKSLWFMDEPEAPLSFRSQLALLGMVHDLVEAGSQFVVASHSPVLLAFPGASIYEFRDDGVERCNWEDLDVVQQVRAFLQSPDQFFRYLFD